MKTLTVTQDINKSLEKHWIRWWPIHIKCKSKYLRKVTEQILKITNKLVLLTPAIRYTLKSLTENCRGTENSLWQKCKRDVHAQIQNFAANY
jgi:hypothetical protein